MALPLDEMLLRELEDSLERLQHAEHELTLLGWLPTSATGATLERLGHERARHAWLLRRLLRPDTPRQT
ncbi:MAG: hypothetical protein SNJ69_03195 [Chloroflexaceae bacterium]